MSAESPLPPQVKLLPDKEKALLILTSSWIYTQFNGANFTYKTCVSSTTALNRDGTPVIGRLLQVRCKNGEFKSDVYLIRTADGTLRTVENDLIKEVPDTLPNLEQDTPSVEYTIAGKFPETGFIIQHPTDRKLPPSSFSIAISKP